MIMKIDCTTAMVVLRPSSSAEDFTCIPRKVPIMAINKRKHRRLAQADIKIRQVGTVSHALNKL